MALDNSRPGELHESDIILNYGHGEGRYGIPNENDVVSSDSDSGNSIFLTQADTPEPPLRKVRRNREISLSSTFGLSEDIADTESEETNGSFEPQSETDSQHIIRQHPSSCRDKRPHRRPRSRPLRESKKKDLKFPFLEKYYGRAFLTLHQRQTVVNSSIGGFFQCMKTLSSTDKQKKPELLPITVSDLSSEEETEDHQDQDDQDDIRIVDGALFIQNFHKRRRQEWGTNTKKGPSKVKNTKKKPPNTKDVLDVYGHKRSSRK